MLDLTEVIGVGMKTTFVVFIRGTRDRTASSAFHRKKIIPVR